MYTHRGSGYDPGLDSLELANGQQMYNNEMQSKVEAKGLFAKLDGQHERKIYFTHN